LKNNKAICDFNSFLMRCLNFISRIVVVKPICTYLWCK